MLRRSLIVAAACALVGAPALAQPSTIVVTDAWVRTPPPGAPTAAGYLTVANRGRADDRLLRAESDAASRVELHSMSMAGGVMSMRAVQGGLSVPAGGVLRLAPGGLHLMLIGPRRALHSGDRVRLSLTFERAGVVRVDVPVRVAGG